MESQHLLPMLAFQLFNVLSEPSSLLNKNNNNTNWRAHKMLNALQHKFELI